MKILFTEEEIAEGIERLAGQIKEHYAGRPLTLVGVMIDSVILLADLIRLLDLPFQVDLIMARTDQGESSRSGSLVLNADLLTSSVQGRDVLLVDDIFDTGQTLWELIPLIDDLGPMSVRSAVLLWKENRREVVMTPDFVVFNIPDEFVVGYGLDYRNRYRHLPYLAVLEPHEIEEYATA